MASGFIAVAIAHDYTCPEGEEWLFHGIPKSSESFMSDGTKAALDKDMADWRKQADKDIGTMIDMDKEDDENDTFWTWVIAAIISLIIGGIALFFILRS